MSLQFTSTVLNCVLNYVNKSAEIEKEKIKELLENWRREIVKTISVDSAMNQIKYEKCTQGVLRNSTIIAVHNFRFKLCFKLFDKFAQIGSY